MLPPAAPTCSLTLSSSHVHVGHEVLVTLQAYGSVSSATIDGHAVGIPSGALRVYPNAPGSYVSTGVVTGPGGSTSCTAYFTAE